MQTVEEGAAPIRLASQNGYSDIVRLLLIHNAEVNIQDKEEYTPLLMATQDGHIEIVRILIDAGAN